MRAADGRLTSPRALELAMIVSIALGCLNVGVVIVGEAVDDYCHDWHADQVDVSDALAKR